MAQPSSSFSEETEPVISNSSSRRRPRTATWRNRRIMVNISNPIDRLRQSGFRNRLLVNLLSEFFATFILLFVGSGAIAQFVLSKGDGGTSPPALNNFAQVSLTWGVLIALCVFATYHTSGGHMNPAVSLAMCSMGKLPWPHFPFYAAVQTLGAFLGSGLCFFLYLDQLNNFDDGIRSVSGPKETASIFCSFPKQHVSHPTAFADQIVGTALLLLFICALIDPRNRVPAYLHPLGFGAAIFMISSSYGMNLGGPINPARDFGPRLFLLCIGYGWEVFSWHDYYFWIPLIVPFFGAIIGTWLYQFFIGMHVPDIPDTQSERKKLREMLNDDSGDDEVDPLNSVVP